METVIGSIVVTALGGITFVAYKHPEAYKTLNIIFCVVGCASVIACASWNLSNTVAVNALFEQFAQNKLELESALIASKIIQSTAVPYWVFGLICAVSLFVLFLATFPKWLRPDSK